MRTKGRKAGAKAPRRIGALVGAVSAAGLVMGLNTSAQALVVKPVYDTSITSRADAAQIESAFNTVAAFYGSQFSNNATVNVAVSWGKVKGQTMGNGALGSSMDNLYGYFTYNQLKGYLTTAANSNAANTALKTAVGYLPTSISGVQQFAISSAEAKALGLISGQQTTMDGFIGFGSSYAYDYNPNDGITASTYDFESVAAHELDEVLGRISGLSSASPYYRMPMDLFRYSAPGAMSMNYNQAAYFSIDGGVTRLGDFNNASNGGDRGDWLSSTTGVGDVQAAFTGMGRKGAITVADLTLLDVLGWGGANMGNTNLWTPTMTAKAFMGTDAVPEPAAWASMLLGAGIMGAQLRRRRRAVRVTA